jgi:hypothetical protein
VGEVRVITHLYRFRSLKRLLDENELLNQEIFFAKPERTACEAP